MKDQRYEKIVQLKLRWLDLGRGQRLNQSNSTA